MVENAENALVLVDDMALKRCFITQFLEKWATECALSIVAGGLDDILAVKPPAEARLVILSIGADSLADPQVLAARRVLAAAYPHRPIVILGDRPDVDNIERALQLGVAGYIPTSLKAEVAIAALDFVLAGGSYFPPEALVQIGAAPDSTPREAPRQLALLASEPSEPRLRPEFPKTNGTGGDTSAGFGETPRANQPILVPTGDLTSRQRQVLACLKQAHSNKEIARELCMSEATVKVHVRQVMKKLGAFNRTHAAVLAAGFVRSEEVMAPNVAPFVTKTPLQSAMMR